MKGRPRRCPHCIDFPKGSATANACPDCHGERNYTPAQQRFEPILLTPERVAEVIALIDYVLVDPRIGLCVRGVNKLEAAVKILKGEK